jgi:hypothetical protein
MMHLPVLLKVFGGCFFCIGFKAEKSSVIVGDCNVFKKAIVPLVKPWLLLVTPRFSVVKSIVLLVEPWLSVVEPLVTLLKPK